MQAAQSNSPAPCGWGVRLAALAVALAALAWLSVGTQLVASPSGSGTHQQLGLPQCSLHAERQIPCPTCGMTTAFSLATQGRLVAAMTVQPAGTLFALGLAVAVWLGGFVAITGVPLSPLVRPLGRRWRLVLVVGLTILLAGWLTQLAAG